MDRGGVVSWRLSPAYSRPCRHWRSITDGVVNRRGRPADPTRRATPPVERAPSHRPDPLRRPPRMLYRAFVGTSDDSTTREGQAPTDPEHASRRDRGSTGTGSLDRIGSTPGAGVLETRPRRVLSADVARACGVSRATVSYVLNNSPKRHISSATRQRVLDAARELGHIPNAVGRSLRLGRTNLVLALISDFTFGYVRDRVVAALDAAMRSSGYALIVHRYVDTDGPEADVWRLLAPDVVVSMVMRAAGISAAIRDAGIPVVEVDQLLDNRRAGEMQADYLYSRGHRHLGYAYPVSPRVALMARERLQGTQHACARLGIPPPHVETVDIEMPETITAALDRWDQEGPKPTAICAHNDDIGLAISLALSLRGRQPGRDLAVMGIDDVPASRVGLSTVRSDTQAVAEDIVRRTLAALEGRSFAAKEHGFLKIIARASA